ncbi:MAG TPA: hypothetical protein VHB48_10130 [Chitinophagaceae bacterium]|nr:hypothetical protein [Chitinophagaceae bacterium]
MKKLLLLYAACYIMQVNAQVPDTSYRLLWFKGRKINENTLVTHALDTVRYNHNTGRLAISRNKGGSKSHFEDMRNELMRTPERINTMITAIAATAPKPLVPLLAANIKEAYEQVRHDLENVLTDTIMLPPAPLPAIPVTEDSIAGQAQKTVDDAFSTAADELVRYVQAHKNDVINSVPTPPAYNFSYCARCTLNRESDYSAALKQFADELGGEDKLVIQKCFGISRQAALLVKGDWIEAKLKIVREYYVARMIKKLRLLFEKYQDDPSRLRAVIWVSLGLDRYIQLAGDNGDDNFETDRQHMLAIAADYIMKAFKEEDYPVALNAAFVFATERQIELMGAGKPVDLPGEFLKFNRFKLSVNLSAKTGGSDGYLLGQLDGDNWFSAMPDSTCNLRWILVGPGINKLKVNLTAADMRGNGGQVKYAGTTRWEGNTPRIKVDFCGTGADTIIIYPFNAENYDEKWQFPAPAGIQKITQLNNVLAGCFIDVNRLQQDAAALKNSGKIEKMKQQMLNNYQQILNSQAFKDISAGKQANVQDILAMAKVQANTGEVANIVGSVTPGRYIFTPKPSMKGAFIFKERLNGKEVFPQNTATVYAWFNLSLIHDAGGPFGIKL